MEGVIPSIWKQGIINPIPKASTTDRRDPLNYRGITVTPACYKLFCRILNARLDKWEAENRILSDNQNGFRKGRITIDHISSLTTLIETRKVKKKSTFAAFIDFRKAYDSVNRNILSEKLKNKGIHGKMYNALKVIYDNVGCTVRINGKLTDWFNVGCGLKQGCSLSSILFNLYIDDLVTKINALDTGIDIGGEKVGILLNSDDVVLLSENERDLQTLLNELNTWCLNNEMSVNVSKSEVMHLGLRRYNKQM